MPGDITFLILPGALPLVAAQTYRRTIVVRKNIVRGTSTGRRLHETCDSLVMSNRSRVPKLMGGILSVFVDVLILFRLALRSSSALAAENLFLRKQLSLYVERKKKPQRATDKFALPLLNFPPISSGEMR